MTRRAAAVPPEPRDPTPALLAAGFAIEVVPRQVLERAAAPYNPRQISEHDLEALRRSLRQWGVVEPIVVNRRYGRIVGGHQRVVAAGPPDPLEALPCVYVDLDDASEKALNLALNRISGEWDDEKLAALIASLDAQAQEMSGFTAREIDRLTREDAARQGLTGPDDVPEPPAEAVTKVGDLIVLGEHRLLCGDSSRLVDVQRLVDGHTIDLLFTDPPYGVDNEPRTTRQIMATGDTHKLESASALGNPLLKRKKMRPRDRALPNDSLSPEDYCVVLACWFRNAAAVLRPGGAFYCWGGYRNCGNYPPALEAAGLYFSQAIIWIKEWPVLNRKDFLGNHEWCFYGWRQGAGHYFNPAVTDASDTWSVRKVSHHHMVHLTEKPVELSERALKYSTRQGETVLDLFGGSGSTLIGAQRLSRRAFVMEIDPIYCDVIVDRWEKHTGRQAARPGLG